MSGFRVSARPRTAPTGLPALATALLTVATFAVLSGCGGDATTAQQPGGVPGPLSAGGKGDEPGRTSSPDPAASSTGPSDVPSGGHGSSGLRSLLPGGGSTTGGPAPGSGQGGGPVPDATRTSVESQAVFSSPSKNIACAMESSYARCDIAERTWSSPPKPAWCEFDYGNGMFLENGKAALACTSDTMLGAPRILGYGQAVRVGSMLCASSLAGMRCQDQRTGHGFVLAKESYQLF
jgi:hypothetical protein